METQAPGLLKNMQIERKYFSVYQMCQPREDQDSLCLDVAPDVSFFENLIPLRELDLPGVG
jgi:hypothetical protein